MATLKFYPYKKTGTTKVYLRLKIGRVKDIRQSTLLTIEDSKSWKDKSPLPKKTTPKNKILCRRLIALQQLIEDKLDSVEKSDVLSLRDINGKWLKNIILTFNNEQPVTSNDFLVEYAQIFTNSLKNSTYKRNGVLHPYSQHTINKYQNFTRHLLEYEKYVGKRLYIFSVDEDFNNTFLNYLTTEKKLAVNTKGMFAKRLKTIIKKAELNDIKVNPKYKNIKGFEAENIVTYLTFKEIDKIIEKTMPSKRFEIAKDWFIISCYTAQRISDLHRFNKSHIQDIDNGRYISFKQFKTSLSIEVPIHYHVERILKKYDDNFPPNFSENEQSNRTILSKLIKEVCKTSRIRNLVRGRYNGVVGEYPKYKLISNHTGRRSFACNFYNLPEWSNAMIMNITGHQNEKSFYKYIDKEDKTLTRNARYFFDKMEQKSIIDSEIKPQLTIVKKAK